MINDSILTHIDDEKLVQQCLAGDTQAFESLVRRYQTLVCSVAYAVVGDVATSEDIGQDTFVAAWKTLNSLKEPAKFKSWVCRIARNQAINSIRVRSELTGQPLPETFSKIEDAPEYQAMMEEDSNILWQTLSSLPLQYREPLVLYYRQEQSVAAVAQALELSTDAVKQRLARGREMLRNEVIEALQRKLRRSIPTASFTIAVMSAVASLGKTAAAATISTGAVAATAKVSSVAMSKAGTGFAGAASGSLLGFFGGFLGTYIGWLTAEYSSQRRFIVRQTILFLFGISVFSVPFAMMWSGWNPQETFGVSGYGLALAAWMIGFMVLDGLWIAWGIRQYTAIEKLERNANTPQLSQHQILRSLTSGWEGRRWSSRVILMGSPLIQIAFCDPGDASDKAKVASDGTARAWIAVGQRAYGRVLALGNIAFAPVAIGTFSVGLLSVGVFSVGIVSCGVLAVALVAVGVLTFGGISSGVVAIGVFAVGPLCIGIIAAKGPLAIAAGYAEGALPIAPEANTDAATEFIANSAGMRITEQCFEQTIMIASGHPLSLNLALAAFILGGLLISFRRGCSPKGVE